MGKLVAVTLVLALLFPDTLFPQNFLMTPKTWPNEIQQVEIPVSDGKNQQAMWLAPASSGQKPLLIGFHTWNGDYSQSVGSSVYAAWCLQQGWAFLHPNFRGPNRTPDAMGSDRAVKDILEAVTWASSRTEIDPDRIYLIGASGGAHMALLMAGRNPELWAGVSAWCPVTDIAQWHEEHSVQGSPDSYAANIEACLGGSPTSGRAKSEARNRSPLKWLGQAAAVPLDINAGIYDGRTGSVPFSHSLRAFNAAMTDSSDKLEETEIASYYETQQLPAGWPSAPADPVYGDWTPVFRKTQSNTRVTLFTGGHEIVYQAGLNWLSLQRRGQAAVWELLDYINLAIAGDESGK